MNLADIVEPHPGSRVALVYEGGETTYGALRERAAALRARLVSSGVQPGDRVGLLLGSTPAFVLSYLGVLGIGAVAVPLNPQSPAPELARELRAVGARVVLTGPEGADRLPSGVAQMAVDPPGQGGQSDGEPPPIAQRDPSDPAVLLFTSGTAGAPKAAILSHENLHSNIEQVEMRVGLAATAEDVGLLVVPPYHILGLNAVLGVQLYAGAKLVMEESFEPEKTLELAGREKVTLLVGVPQLFAALAGVSGATGAELSSVRLACSGGAPLPASTASAFTKRFGVDLRQGYGLTEASPTVTFPDLSAPARSGTVGVPLPGVELKLVDEHGDEVLPGDPGEVLVRGPNVFCGYYGDEKATRQSLDGAGWLHTGDLGILSEEGELSIVDRQKDLVIVSGFNVYPGEVEDVLVEHELVAEAAVIGLPDDKTGEHVAAFVVLRPEAWPEGSEPPAGAGELLEHCMARLARYKCPRSFTFVRELPHGPQGKILRRAVSAAGARRAEPTP